MDWWGNFEASHGIGSFWSIGWWDRKVRNRRFQQYVWKESSMKGLWCLMGIYYILIIHHQKTIALLSYPVVGLLRSKRKEKENKLCMYDSYVCGFCNAKKQWRSSLGVKAVWKKFDVSCQSIQCMYVTVTNILWICLGNFLEIYFIFFLWLSSFGFWELSVGKNNLANESIVYLYFSICKTHDIF